jgi:hypothetical protein
MAKKLSTTPKGKLVWPRLSGTADFKFDEAGVWSTKQTLSAADAAPHVAAIDEAMAAALAEGKTNYAKAKAEYAALKVKSGKKPPSDKMGTLLDAPYFTDEETGDVTFTFKMVASGVNKKTQQPFTQKPVLFDAKGKVITGDIRVGGGTIARVSYELTSFAKALGCGASLRLKAVQIIELVEFGQDGGYYGFGEEEGFAAENAPDTSAAEEMGFTDNDAAVATEVAPGSESDDF